MQKYQGKAVFGGIAIGKIHVYQKDEQQVKRTKISDPETEILRYEAARDEADKQLASLYEKALLEVGEANAAIFQIHQMMLGDDDYNESVENIIRTQCVNAEYAVAATSDNFSQMFAAMDDEYMQERAADVKDISERVLTILSGAKKNGMILEEPVIIVAEDLAPSETVQLDKEKVLAFVTVKGAVNSHTAILARTMGIPALIGTPVELDATQNGRMAAVDGDAGILYLQPEEEQLRQLEQLQQEEQKKKEMLKLLKGRENVTIDGKEIMLYANIGDMKDLASVLQNDAGGIGLFRSEFIYLGRTDYPTEEEQFQIYKTVVETMAGKKVIIRTLDIGADKQCEYFGIEQEENPAMGLRAIRICLTRPEIFKTQMRALYRASAYGNLAIMYPMIANIWEIQKIKEIAAEVEQELTAQGVEFKRPQQGIMIETPAAVMLSEELAKEVDFFSIGTNDLTQYTLAVDRQNPNLDVFYNPRHPAVLKMIELVVQNAHKAGIWAGICGELGADTELTKEFLAMGVDELSVSPNSILPIRSIILETDIEAYKKG
ncbi:phosphoenolpyruvate--protein phosphotransferase [Lachnospiraceae bacterium OttesenSCG-928-E19]|nr:phosphoenolpyruvate--protein phosphotransferase [Lachnospiraceae bacterium OttesenSCG-928-E19]